jgi:hypothetical protein
MCSSLVIPWLFNETFRMKGLYCAEWKNYYVRLVERNVEGRGGAYFKKPVYPIILAVSW